MTAALGPPSGTPRPGEDALRTPVARPRPGRHRRWPAALLVGVVAACSAMSMGSESIPASGANTDPRDEPGIVDRVRAELAVFTGWLAAQGVDGYIGEVGWPDDGSDRAERWNEVGEVWYRDADAAGLWVSQWATGEWWDPDYALAVYFQPSGGSSVTEPKAQARVIEAHPSTARYHRGMNVNGGEFGAVASTTKKDSFSNENPGTYGEDWHYDSQETFSYLVGRGHRHGRLLFRWERVQPTLGGPLDPEEVRRLKEVVARAHSAGMQIIPTVGNFGAYMLHDPETDQGIRRAIGSAEVSPQHFHDLWRRLSLEFAGDPGILAYGLMNEPVFLPGASTREQARLWEQVSQGALLAIRGNGDRTLVMVPGYYWSHVYKWAELHPEAWITDPADRVRYEAHHYFGEYG